MLKRNNIKKTKGRDRSQPSKTTSPRGKSTGKTGSSPWKGLAAKRSRRLGETPVEFTPVERNPVERTPVERKSGERSPRSGQASDRPRRSFESASDRARSPRRRDDQAPAAYSGRREDRWDSRRTESTERAERTERTERADRPSRTLGSAKKFGAKARLQAGPESPTAADKYREEIMRELTTWNDGTEPAQAAAEETIVQSVEQTSPRPKSKRQSKSTDQPESEDQRQPDSHEFSFAELDLSETMQAAIDRLGFEAPTPIQFKAIPALATGRDFIGIAQTGTGKTAAFGIPLLQKLDFDSKVVQALVLAPTRELALQTAAGIKELGHGTGLKIAAVYGGAPIGRQISELKGGAQIVVGTPGRILDHLNRGSINLSQVETCILDEADEMLALGFAEDLETILGSLPSQRQMAFFSATMPARITALTHKYLDNPLRVTIESKQRTHELTTERYYEVERGQKLLALTRILAMEMPGPTIIFCRTKQDTADLTERLRGTGISAEAIHGDINQAERERVLRRFRDGLNTVLVATDVAARGLDISGVTHVVNFDIPGDPEQYIHRIGRTGRAGRNGDAITLISPRERGKLKMIQRITGAKIEQGFVPTEAEIHRFKRELFAETILAAATAAEESGTNAPTDFMQLAADLSEKLGALESLATVLQQLWTIQNPAAKGSGSRENGRSSSESGRSGRGYEGSPSGSFIKVRLSMGKMDGLRPGDIVGAIVKEAGVPSQHVGSIDLGDRFSVVELASETAEAIMETLRNTTLRNKEVHVRLWDEDGGSPSSGRSGAARGRRIHRGGAENRYSESPEYARGGDYSRSRVTTRNRG